ncbi:MAG: hypothetical protein ACYC99_14610 [Candidatus Geothermincolia bacterium]
MSCYFRHIGDIFSEAGIEITAGNRKDVDRRIHEIVGVPYKNCPVAWRKLKEMKADEEGRRDLIEKLKA